MCEIKLDKFLTCDVSPNSFVCSSSPCFDDFLSFVVLLSFFSSCCFPKNPNALVYVKDWQWQQNNSHMAQFRHQGQRYLAIAAIPATGNSCAIPSSDLWLYLWFFYWYFMKTQNSKLIEPFKNWSCCSLSCNCIVFSLISTIGRFLLQTHDKLFQCNYKYILTH